MSFPNGDNNDPVRNAQAAAVVIASLALLAFAIGAPIAYYHVEVFKAAAEKNMEQQLDRGHVIWVSKKDK